MPPVASPPTSSRSHPHSRPESPRSRRPRHRFRATLAGGSCFALLTGALIAGAAAPATAASATDWPTFLGDNGHTSYNASATSIKPTNAAGLVSVWNWLVPTATTGGSQQLLASPTISNGVVYIGAGTGYFFAVNEATQTVKWSDFLGVDTAKGSKPCGPATAGIEATAAIANDPKTGKPTVYVNSPDGNLYALDAATGATVWKGVVDTPSTTANDYYSWGSPLVANGKVYVGISSYCDSPLVPGGLTSFDQASGANVATWYTLPATAKGVHPAGGSVWSTPGVMANGNIVVSTGNGYEGQGQPLYDESIVELNPTTLSLVDFWQVPATDRVIDSDFGASPTMFTATIAGVSTPMVGACNKNGLFYAFRQSNLAAGPVWKTRITVAYPGGALECDSSAVWNGTSLIIGGGAQTTIGTTTYPGSVQALNPATGAAIWQTGLPGTIVGTPTEDGGGVVAAQTYSSTTNQLGVYLLNGTTGAILGQIPTHSKLFGQAVFVGSQLVIGGGPTYGLTAYAVPTIGPPITKVAPAIVAPGKTSTLTLTGSGFSGTPKVFFSGTKITVQSVTVSSATSLKVGIYVGKTATTGTRNITVMEPGPVSDSCSACLTIGTPPPSPVVTSINPNTFVHGASKQGAAIMGANFVVGAHVTSHGGVTISVVSFVGSTQLNVSVSVLSTLAPGSYNVFVYNPDGSSGECKGCLTVT
jgi:outer membrane protein assembly factor BamB